eukprot:COSAG01_NODE_1793_length_9215_cov_16.655002_7_plen_354_part_00
MPQPLRLPQKSPERSSSTTVTSEGVPPQGAAGAARVPGPSSADELSRNQSRKPHILKLTEYLVGVIGLGSRTRAEKHATTLKDNGFDTPRCFEMLLKSFAGPEQCRTKLENMGFEYGDVLKAEAHRQILEAAAAAAEAVRVAEEEAAAAEALVLSEYLVGVIGPGSGTRAEKHATTLKDNGFDTPRDFDVLLKSFAGPEQCRTKLENMGFTTGDVLKAEAHRQILVGTDVEPANPPVRQTQFDEEDPIYDSKARYFKNLCGWLHCHEQLQEQAGNSIGICVTCYNEQKRGLDLTLESLKALTPPRACGNDGQPFTLHVLILMDGASKVPLCMRDYLKTNCCFQCVVCPLYANV